MMNNKRHTLIPCRSPPLVLAMACVLAGPAFAQNLPSGFNGVSGVNAPTTIGNTMTVTQTAPRGIAEWQSFSIGKGYTVKFNQPGASSVLLNRVVGNDLSTIAGTLSANGRIYLINPKGILFSQGSSVSVGGLVASTLDVSNSDFLTGGKLKFSRLDGNDAAVVNEGAITAASGGTIALMAARVTNTGTLSAPDGTVGLVSGRTVNVDFDGDGLTTFTIPNDSLASAALVENSGQVDADGGRIVLLAASTVREQVVKQSGTLRARSLSNRGGEIVLGGDTASGNEVLVGGEVDVSGNGAGVAGGSVSAKASSVMVENARIDASGVGQGGSIAVNASAGNVGLFNSRADASGTGQGGSISVHADSAPDQSSSGIIAMDKDSSLHADATGPRGDGGQIVLLAEAITRAHGTLTARAGNQGGDGGFIETSAAALDLGGIIVNASAPAGRAGEWLLDPYNVFIDHGVYTGASDPFTPTVNDTVIYDGDINYSLNNGTDVTIHTGTAGSQEGDITFGSGVVINKTSGGPATLTLSAYRDISDPAFGGHVNSIIMSSSGELNVKFRADRQVYYAGRIETNGGDVTMTGNEYCIYCLLGSGSAGVLLRGATVDTRTGAGTGGSVTIIGMVGRQGGPGVWLSSYGGGPSTRISTATGNVSIQGYGFVGDFPVYSDFGIVMNNSHIETTSGSITLSGGSDGSYSGVRLWDYEGGNTITTTGGRIDVTGSTPINPYGIQIEENSRISGGGDVILRASNGGTTDALVINGLVSASGVLNLRPGELAPMVNNSYILSVYDLPTDQIFFSPTGNVNEDLGTGFSISAAELGCMSASTIVVGSDSHRGNITVDSNRVITTSSPLTLQNDGSGSGGIILNTPISAPTLGLVSGGNITQGSGGRINANNLYARSSGGNVSLNATGNSVGTLNGGAASTGSFAFANDRALRIVSTSVTGFDATSNTPQTISSTTLIANTVQVQTFSGDLTLAMPISSSSTDLVAGWRFQNNGSGSITGGPWRVWAGTSAGESRGTMVGTGDDIYDCSFGGSCVIGAGNYFIYGPAQANILPALPPPPEVESSGEWLLLEEEGSDSAGDSASEQEEGGSSSELSGFVVFCLDAIMPGGASNANDVLAREWARVRVQPQTSGCLGVDGRKGCAGF